jgi:hypothetical protein
VSNQDELVFSYASGLKHIGRHSSSYTNDAGTAITSRWQSGWFDYSAPWEKDIRETKIWGYGNVVLSLGCGLPRVNGLDAGHLPLRRPLG